MVLDEMTVYLPLIGLIDMAQERIRLEKEIQKLKQEITKLNLKLDNQEFVAKAPQDVVAEQRQRLEELQGILGKTQSAWQVVSE